MNKIVKSSLDIFKDVVIDFGSNIEKEAYMKGIEVGISNTIKTLLYADINDRNIIINCVRKVWRIDEKVIEDKILIEKKNILAEIIKEQLKFTGYTKIEIESFFTQNIVKIKLNRNYSLWKLKNSPEKLVKAVEED